MTTAHHAPGLSYDVEDTRLVADLLDGAEPDAYVVAKLGDLVWQVQAVVGDEIRQHGKVSAARASYKLTRLLLELDLVVDTKHIRSSS